ncbi:MAG: hypothetical protein ACYDEA_00545 [Candidatus Dormibacteria bacterium]
MSHILIALALCAALVIYPGGASAVVALWLVSAQSKFPWTIFGRGEFLRSGRPGGAWLGAGALCGLVVLPLPWAGNPVTQMDVGGLGGASLGGLALSLLGLFWLESMGRAGRRPVLAALLSLGWALAVVALAVALRAPGWAGVIGGSGLGAELARLALGLSAIIAIPWVGGSDPQHDICTAAAWSARLALGLSLVVPQLAALPAGAALGIWWGACLLLAAAWAGGLRGVAQHLGMVTGSAATDRM